MGILNIEKLDDFKLNNANNINLKYHKYLILH